MKFKIILFLLLLNVSFSQECNIFEKLPELITFRKYNDTLLVPFAKMNLPEDHCYQELINTNPYFFHYLMTHFAPRDFNLLKNTELDSAAKAERYIEQLKNDSLFANILLKLQAKKYDKNFVPDTFKFYQVKDVAVKFFTVTKVVGKGYKARVCIGINEIENTLPERLPFVEAFVFSAIFNDIRSGKSKVINDFFGTVREIGKYHFGLDEKERLLRAQGAIWIKMADNKNLEKLLVKEYKKMKGILPFVIEDL